MVLDTCLIPVSALVEISGKLGTKMCGAVPNSVFGVVFNFFFLKTFISHPKLIASKFYLDQY